MFGDSKAGNPMLAIFEAMLMTFASLLALAEAAARIGQARLGARAATLVSTGGRRSRGFRSPADRRERFAPPPSLRPSIRLRRISRDRKPALVRFSDPPSR
jgi:hypothetical protein